MSDLKLRVTAFYLKTVYRRNGDSERLLWKTAGSGGLNSILTQMAGEQKCRFFALPFFKRMTGKHENAADLEDLSALPFFKRMAGKHEYAMALAGSFSFAVYLYMAGRALDSRRSDLSSSEDF